MSYGKRDVADVAVEESSGHKTVTKGTRTRDARRRKGIRNHDWWIIQTYLHMLPRDHWQFKMNLISILSREKDGKYGVGQVRRIEFDQRETRNPGNINPTGMAPPPKKSKIKREEKEIPEKCQVRLWRNRRLQNVTINRLG